MELENVFEIGRLLGICKIWTTDLRATNSPFYQTMPSPINLLINKLETLKIHESTIKELEALMDLPKKAMEIIKTRDSLEGGSENERFNELTAKMDEITKELRDIFIKKIPIWEDRITNELNKTKVVKLSTDTILNPEKLSLGAHSFFDENVWNKMSKLEKEDLDDGTRCISLQAWTPAAMITMRVIESVLRNYYRKITSNDPMNKTWGGILTDLKQNTSADQKLIGYFDYLKDIRNALQHPDARMSQFEAEDIFHHAIHIINTYYI